MAQACEQSPKRLDVEVIDLYYLHHRSDEVPIEETVGAMSALVSAGKVRRLGLSNVTADDVRRAQVVHPISGVQEEWSLENGEVERMAALYAELGLAVVAYTPQGFGRLALLDRAADSIRRPAPSTCVRDMAGELGVTSGQLALAWVHSRSQAYGLVVVPLPGTNQADHVSQNRAAAEIDLSEDDLARLDAALRGPVRRTTAVVRGWHPATSGG